MPVKKNTSSARRSRIVRPAHQSKIKTLKVTRSLSEVRQRSSEKEKIKQSRTSVASQSDRRTSPQKASLSASVYDTKGKAVGRITLPVEIFGASLNKQLIAQAVRVYLANQRFGTQSTKTRGEVRGSTRKIYKQKGTGRARHGGIRAPIFVGGGTAHGPHPRDFSLSLPQKMKRKALFSALSGKLKDGEIKIVDLAKIAPKTKVMAKALKALEIPNRILLVTPAGANDCGDVFKASRNLRDMKILPAVNLNTYDILNNKTIILMKEAIDVMKKHYLTEKE